MQIIHTIKQKLQQEDKKIISDSFWNFTGSMFGQLMMCVVSLINARILGAVEFGKWGVILSTIGIFTTFLSLGVSVTAMKHLAEYRDSDKTKASKVYSISLIAGILFGFLLSILMYFSSGMLANEIFKSSDLEIILKVSSSFLFLNAVMGVFSGSISGLDGYKDLSNSNLLAAIVGGIPIVLLTKYNGLLGTALGYSFYYILLCIFFYVQLIKRKRKFEIEFTIHGLKKELSLLYNYSLPAMITGSIGGPVIWGVTVIVSRMGNGFEILGIYNAAKICQNILINIGVKLNNPLITLLSNFRSKRAEYLSNFIPLAFILLFAVPFISFPELFTWLFKNTKYEGESFNVIISITTLTAYIVVFKQIYGRQIITNNKLWLGVWENIIWSVLIFGSVYAMREITAINYSLCFLFSYFIDLVLITPIYMHYRLINRKFVINIYSLLLWILLFGAVWLNYIDASFYLKIFLYLGVLYFGYKNYKVLEK